ncbi:hypothetical protein [Roseibium sediminicola]|uniref:Lipoprotein n=1 Tax=Roseibium sediminicola TaxID=2933272 RepID=A0ABT0GSB1_9HYPH|nr:hypothetical protein [Roseibium sp. CAU 1639]MCK7611952.1 hypothetical protein [Roseibium sp. CAU 1639]
MRKLHLLAAMIALSVSACVGTQGGGNSPAAGLVAGAAKAVTPDAAGEVGDVCKALSRIKWTEADADHVSGTLAGSLDEVLEMEREHGCK